MTLTSAARASTQRMSLITDRWRPAGSGPVVLIYHRVNGGTGASIDMPADRFRRQLEYLLQQHAVVPLDDAVAAIRDTGGDTHPDTDDHRAGAGRHVVLTFDDGTADFADTVTPILAEYRVPATLYVATAFIADGTPFPWGATPLSPTAVADVASTPWVSVQSHSHTHPSFATLDASAAADQLRRADDLIAEWTGHPPRHFAYPRAIAPTSAAEVVVRRTYATAALAGGGPNITGTDLHRLRRSPVLADDSDAVFAARANGGMRLEGWARAVRLRARQRGLAT